MCKCMHSHKCNHHSTTQNQQLLTQSVAVYSLYTFAWMLCRLRSRCEDHIVKVWLHFTWLSVWWWSCNGRYRHMLCTHTIYSYMITFIFDISYWMIENEEEKKGLPKVILYRMKNPHIMKNPHTYWAIFTHKCHTQAFHCESTIVY